MIRWSSSKSRMRRSEARVKLRQFFLGRDQRKAEAARIVIAKLATIVQSYDDVVVLATRTACLDPYEFS